MKKIYNAIQYIEHCCSGTIGVSAYHVQRDISIQYNSHLQFLLCSTYKLPIAISLLKKVEKKELSLEQSILIHDYDLRIGVSSTLNQLQYASPVQMSVLNILQYMLQESCNTASDIILRLVGGATTVMKMLKEEEINDLRIDRSTLEILADWDGIKHMIPTNHHCTLSDYHSYTKKTSIEDLDEIRKKFKQDVRDCGTPDAMSALLKRLARRTLLNEKHTNLLLKLMLHCKRGENRIMGLLPPKIKVAHKTGTLSGYVNDVGIIYLPDNLGEVAISVYVTNRDLHQGERAIAEVSRLIYDYIVLT